MDKCYSSNEEDFSDTCLEDAVESAWNNRDEAKVGDVVSVWEGDAVKHSASFFVPCGLSEQLEEQAYDLVGEYADSWDFSNEEAASLQKAVETAVDAWAAANNKQPNFYTAENVREIRVRITNEDGAFEVIT